jgi:hypothetical protein
MSATRAKAVRYIAFLEKIIIFVIILLTQR